MKKSNNNKIFNILIPLFLFVVLISMILGTVYLLKKPNKTNIETTTLENTINQNNETLFKQISKRELDKVALLTEPLTFDEKAIPTSWIETNDPEIGFTFSYPPSWTYFKDGEFCHKPDESGSCQDHFPFEYILPAENNEGIPLTERTSNYIRSEVAKIRLNGIDGVVVYSYYYDLQGNVVKGNAIYIKDGDKIHVFGFDLSDPEQKQVFSTLKLK